MKKVIFTILALSFSFLLFPSSVQAKDYSIKSADINVQINGDGTADVNESRTYSFNGNYSWADEWILKKQFTINK